MVTYENIFRRIRDWQMRTFKHPSAAGAVDHYRREADELWGHHWIDMNQRNVTAVQPRAVPTGTRTERVEEAIDGIFLILQYLTLEGCGDEEIKATLEAKLEKNISRSWPEAPDARGVYEHKKA